MPSRQGGFEVAEREAGIRAVREARSPEVLAKLLDELPVLHAPVFHRDVLTHLRQELPPEERRQFERLFCYLDWRAQQRHGSAPAEVDEVPQAHCSLPYAPPYFQQVMELLKGQVPPYLPERPLDPATEESKIADGLMSVNGTPVALPPYQPVPGSQWGIVIIECLRCRTRRPEARALHIDLIRVPDMRAPLAEGRINNAACPHCGFKVGLPAGVWLLDPPWPRDTLAVLSCLIRVDPLNIFYLPSCWRQREHQMVVVLEARSSQLLNDLQVESAPSESGPDKQLVRIIYSQDELKAQLNASSGGQVPLLMEAAVAQLALRLEAEEMSLEEAREFARAWVAQEGKDWPLLMSPIHLDEEGRPMRAVAQALLTEQLAEHRNLEVLDRAILSIQLVAMLLEAQRVGQAEAVLARAEDLWNQIQPGDDDRHLIVASMIERSHSDILTWKGRYEEAAQRRHRAEELLPSQPEGSWWVRFQFWRYRAVDALHLRREKKFDESLVAFAQCIPMLEQLYGEALQENAPEGQAARGDAQNILGGALANCASVLQEGEGVFSNDPSRLHTHGMAWVFEYAARLPAWPSEPEDSQDEGSRRWIVVGRLLKRALDLSQASRAWRFAAAQAMRLTDVMLHFGHLHAAVEQASEWVKFAQQANHYHSLAHALFFLGRMGLHLARHGPGSLDLFESAAESLLRDLVSQGPQAELPHWAPMLVEMSFLCVKMGADAGKAVMIAESLKAAVTAVHVEAGVPGSGRASGEFLAQRVEELTCERERLRVETFNFEEGEPERAELSASIERVEQQLAESRRELGLRNAQYVRWCEPSYIHLSAVDDIRRRLDVLGSRATYLGFSIGEIGVWTYALWSEGIILEPVSWEGWREDLKILDAPDALLSDPKLMETVLERVGRRLLEPVLERLELMSPSDRLIISPTQGLLHVPFAAFPIGAERLVQQFVLSVVSGAGLFEACFDRRPGPISSALLVGVPRHDYMKVQLPYARDEVKKLESLLRDSGCEVRLLLDQQATASAVLSEAAAYDVLHFACHARWSLQAAIRPQLVLHPDFERDSGELTDWRIVNELRLRPGALVNLSACQSARQIEGGAEIRDGLLPAILQAGAGAAVATLWSISDAPMPVLQTVLYENLLAGQPPAEALARTLRRCIQGELGPVLADPLVWLAFMLYGVG